MTIHQQINNLREKENHELFMCQDNPNRSKDTLNRIRIEIRKLEKQADEIFQKQMKHCTWVG